MRLTVRMAPKRVGSALEAGVFGQNGRRRARGKTGAVAWLRANV
jgi:hypothetical protein